YSVPIRLFDSFPTRRSSDLGNGGHAHNDQLSITLVVDAVPWIADPGSYLYTPFPEIRNRYRSVVAHFAPRPVHGEPASLDEGLLDRKSTRLNSSHVKISYAV